MKKVCTYCGLERDAEQDFKWEYKSKGLRQSRCKYCQAELGKRHYQNNKETDLKRKQIHKAQTLAENTRLIATYLSTHPCVDCGEADIRLLEFDHVSGKKSRGIADLLSWGFNWQTIEEEIMNVKFVVPIVTALRR